MYQLVITFIFVSIPLMSGYVIDISQDVISQINTTRYPKHISVFMSMNSLWFFYDRLSIFESCCLDHHLHILTIDQCQTMEKTYVPLCQPITKLWTGCCWRIIFIRCRCCSLWNKQRMSYRCECVLMAGLRQAVSVPLMKIAKRDTCLLVDKKIINVLIHFSIDTLFNWQILNLSQINWSN